MNNSQTPRTDALIAETTGNVIDSPVKNSRLATLARTLETENARLRAALSELTDATESEAKGTFWRAASELTVRSFNARMAAKRLLEG